MYKSIRDVSGLSYDPIHSFLGVSPIECNGNYFDVDMHRIVPLGHDGRFVPTTQCPSFHLSNVGKCEF